MTTYVVIDVEFDGPIPGVNSMISIGAIAINKQGDELGEFEVNLLPMETAKIDEATMNWFNNEAPEALKYCRKNALKPDQAMTKFGDWLINLPSPRIMAAHPGPTDYMWIHYYILTFLSFRLEKFPFLAPFFNYSPAFDIKSFASSVLKKDFSEISRNNYPLELHDNSRHTHKAIEDAREYSKLLIKLFRL
tara:strand:- start:306 stop:878 length:573 start_codon:yes stop_codon:yes gene_type:complete